jgi:adenylate cyclase
MSDAKDSVPRRGTGDAKWQHQLRLYSGLLLFIFAATHLLNHTLGLFSVEAMEAVRSVRSGIWRSPPGTVLLYGALIAHVVLSLYKFVKRRSWRVSLWEGLQLGFGLVIPFLLFRHILGTRMPHEVFGLDDNYRFALYVMWPAEALNQLMLITLVWVHGCVGMHFWLRMKAWYGRIVWPAFAFAVLTPVLAYAGFSVGGRAVHLEGNFVPDLNGEQVAFIYSTMSIALWCSVGVIGAAVAYRLVRMARDRLRPKVRITYSDGRSVTNEVGSSLLDISRIHGVPHASVCGGRARCSTCRVRILEGLEGLDVPAETERKVLERVGAGSNVRLACQLVPTHDLSVAMLLPAKRVQPDDVARQDKYLWGVEQNVAILFADIRGFTALSETKLPYDVVFMLNQYLGQMSDAIDDAGGYVDKFIGDGIMAIFGMEKGPEAGARDALRAARAMGGVLDALNRSLAADLASPLNIGIGIHTGPAILGRIGVSDASGATQRITALGDTVNTASRLESSSKELGCQLVFSDATAGAAGFDLAEARRESIMVKGREEPVEIAAYARALDLPAAETAL